MPSQHALPLALERAAETLRTHPAELDETFWTSAARAALLAFNQCMYDHYVGDMYLEQSFGYIVDMLTAAS